MDSIAVNQPVLKAKSVVVMMAPSEDSPLRLFILPQKASRNARFCTLAHPRTSQLSRYYFCSETGLYELTRIAAPKAVCQSWLLSTEEKSVVRVSNGVEEKDLVGGRPEQVSVKAEDGNEDTEDKSIGYVVMDPEVFVATPIDLLFLILPAFLTKSSSSKSPVLKNVFLSLEDLLESLRDNSKHLDQTLCHDDLRQGIEARIVQVCDMVKAENETMYRLNLHKLLQELLFKAKEAVALGLPASMEERFIRKALEVPTMALKREESWISEQSKGSQETNSDSRPSDSTASQSSATTVETSFSISSANTAITTPDVEPPERKDDTLAPLLRLRTALSYIISSYLPSILATSLNTKLCSATSPVDFAQLNRHLAHLSALRAEALASRSMSDFSRKRNLEEDDEVAEARAEKKRKKEEEEKRKKAGESRGLRSLKKVDVSGMKKMSDFFGKKAAKKAN
ncbi:hypothetical protein MMC07_003215 [Pseudocyphellaria aurata]|nr:hypothetical protein [Pseudocyphellaria aurata]